jgi:integrase
MNRPVSEWFSQYLACSQLADTTKEVKARVCRWFAEFAGDPAPDAVNYGLAEDFRNFIAKRSGRGVNTYIRVFQPFWVWLQRRQIIQVNPFAELRDLRFEKYVGENFTPAEIERLIRVGDEQWQIIVIFGALGLRRAETLNLCRENIDLNKGYIQIKGKRKSETTWIWNIKNHIRRFVPLPKNMSMPDMIVPVHRVIEEVQNNLPHNQPYLCLRPEVYKHRIRQQQAGELKADLRNCPWPNFSRDFHRLQKYASIVPKRYQDLRATFATTLAAQLPLKETQSLMGHRTAQTTLEYYIRVDKRQILEHGRELLSNCYVSSET